MAKRAYKPTLKMVLVRDFNWRMGNLRRLMMCIKVLDSDLQSRADWCVQVQMDRERSRHTQRLDGTLQDGIYQQAEVEVRLYAASAR